MVLVMFSVSWLPGSSVQKNMLLREESFVSSAHLIRDQLDTMPIFSLYFTLVF